MRTSAVGLNEIKESESFREHAYPDPYSPLGRAAPAGRTPWGYKSALDILPTLPADIQKLSGAPWTIGFGVTENVKPGDVVSRWQAETDLMEKARRYEEAVTRACKLTPTQGQFDALVSLAWNIGAGAIGGSTIIKCHNRGDFEAASRAFGLWDKVRVGGKLVSSPGLTARRRKEGAAYLKASPTLAAAQAATAAGTTPAARPEAPMPQVVEPESSLGASSINKSAAVAGGTAGVAAVTEVVRTVSDAKSAIDGLGDWLLPLLLVAVVALCGYIIYTRYKQRKEGWA
jgi:lysozyme